MSISPYVIKTLRSFPVL